MFSCDFCEISKNTFSTQHLWTTASILTWNLKSQESYLNSHGDTYFFRNVFKQTSVLSRYHNYKNNTSSRLKFLNQLFHSLLGLNIDFRNVFIFVFEINKHLQVQKLVSLLKKHIFATEYKVSVNHAKQNEWAKIPRGFITFYRTENKKVIQKALVYIPLKTSCI